MVYKTIQFSISMCDRFNLMQEYYNRRLDDKLIFQEAIKVIIEILRKDIGGLVVSFGQNLN